MEAELAACRTVLHSRRQRADDRRELACALLRAAALDMDLKTLEQAQQAAAQALGAPGWQADAEYAPLLRRIGVLFETAPVALN